jgi:hypothetical protein
MAIPFMLFVALPIMGLFVFAWCFLCYKVGCWIVNCFTPRRRPEFGYARYAPPPYPVRRRSGRGGVFLTLLVVCLVIFGLSSFSHHRHAGHAERARAFRDQARAKMQKQVRKVQQAFHREPPPPPPEVAPEPPALVAVASGEPADNDANAGWITGYGETVTDAEQDAYDKAYDKALAYLHETMPGLQWKPSRKYVQEHWVKDLRHEPSKEITVLGKPQTTQQVSVHVEVTTKDRADIVKQDRHYRVEDRLFLLAKVLGGLVLLLSTIATYIRLDEYSKGFYTGWLRLAGAAAVAAAGALLFIA